MPRLLATLAFLLFVIAPPSNAQAPARRCAECGQIILDEYLTLEGRTFHPEHVLCGYCGKPIDDMYATADNKFFHGECYQKRFVVLCGVCNKVVQDDYVDDFWGNRVHAAHQADTPTCDFCARFIAGGFAADAATLPDGRRLCGHCAGTSVTTINGAKDVATLVSSSLDAHGVRVGLDGVSFLLLGKEKMRAMSKDPQRHALGFTDYQIAGSHAAAHCNIVLLNGMPELQMAAALAHEIMHVWLFRAGVSAGGPWIEGSCEYASYLVMIDVGTKESQFVIHHIEANADSVYGGGFRAVKQFVEKNGVAGWLDALTPPPAGE